MPAQDQAWREKRRVRELEEMRARSGGIQLGSSGAGAGLASSSTGGQSYLFQPARRPDGVSGINPGFPGLSQCRGLITHVLLTRSPLSPGPKPWFSLDLHVLSAPPAFVLSQDQTLREEVRPEGRSFVTLSLCSKSHPEGWRQGFRSQPHPEGCGLDVNARC